MKFVVDAIGVRSGSAAVVIGNTLQAWSAVFPEDELVVLTDGCPPFAVPAAATVVALVLDTASGMKRLLAQSFGVRRCCRREHADALLSALSAGSFLGAGCPSGAILYDLRHEIRPEQFGLGRRLARRLLYGWTFRRADVIFCISERTRRDLVTRRPALSRKAVVTLLGADHVAGWHATQTSEGNRFVLAFAHFQNKNPEAVVRAWKLSAARHPRMNLVISGVPPASRKPLVSLVRSLDLADRVQLLPWLPDEEFEQMFSAAAAVVFPSEFEGFGLPALEAMRLGIPVVVSADPALAEVTAGHAFVASDDLPSTLAEALNHALTSSCSELAAATEHARSFTWARTAAQIRAALTG